VAGGLVTAGTVAAGWVDAVLDGATFGDPMVARIHFPPLSTKFWPVTWPGWVSVT
jgi:hypothetical protein